MFLPTLGILEEFREPQFVELSIFYPPDYSTQIVTPFNKFEDIFSEPVYLVWD